MYYVYVIQNPDSRFYIGCTDDVNRRLENHNTGISTWTRYRGPWTLIWQKKFQSLGEARIFENLLKRQKGGKGFTSLTGIPLPPSRS